MDCSQCHSGGRYKGTPTDCYTCHSRDYDRTNNPNHAASGFPTDCTRCHSTNGWSPASFNHDAAFFPIYSGRHRGVWSSCSDCHVGGNTGSFSCINGCHTNQSQLNSEHHDVNGYSYASTSCYRCHPRGSGGD